MGSLECGGDSFANWEPIVAFSRWRQRAELLLEKHAHTTLLQFWILLSLHANKAMGVKQIAHMLELKYTTVTEAVVKLEKQQFITKTNDENDRRATLVSITQHGFEEFASWDKILIDAAVDAWRDFPKDKRRRAFFLFWQLGESAQKVRYDGEIVRGDTAFFIACEQIWSKYKKTCESMRVSSEQGLLLLLLACRGELQPKEIAKLLIKQACDVSKLLHSTEELGFIEIRTGATKRELVVSINEQGLRIAGELDHLVSVILSQHFGEEEAEKQLVRQIGQYLTRQLRN